MNENQVEPALLAQLLRQALGEGKQAHLTLSSDSMAPLLRRGDRLVLEAIALGQLQPGDIVVVADSGGLLVHRFWAHRNSWHPKELVLRGDSLTYFDRPAPVEALVGLVVARLRGGKILYVDRPPGSQLDRRLRRAAQLENQLYPQPWKRPKEVGAGWPPSLAPPTGQTVRNRVIRWLLRRYMWAVVAIASPRAESPFRDG